MANRFLNDTSGGGDLSSLQNGSFDLNVSTIKMQSALLNSVLTTDSDKKIIGLSQLPTDKIDYDFSDIVHNPNSGSLTTDDLQADTITAKTNFLTLQTPDGKALYKNSEVATMADVLSASGTGVLLWLNYSVPSAITALSVYPNGIQEPTIKTITPTPTGPTFIRSVSTTPTTASATQIDITCQSIAVEEALAQFLIPTATYAPDGFITQGLWEYSVFGHVENSNALGHLQLRFHVYGHATGQPFDASNLTLISSSSLEPIQTLTPNKQIINLTMAFPYTNVNAYDNLLVILTIQNNESPDHGATIFFESDSTYSHLHTSLYQSSGVSPATITSLQNKTQNINEALTTTNLTTINGVVDATTSIKTNTIDPHSGTTTTLSGNLIVADTKSITADNMYITHIYPKTGGDIAWDANIVCLDRQLNFYGNSFLRVRNVLGNSDSPLYIGTYGTAITDITIQPIGNILANSDLVVSSGKKIQTNTLQNTTSGTNLNITATSGTIQANSDIVIVNGKRLTVDRIDSTTSATNLAITATGNIALGSNTTLGNNNISGVNNMSATSITTNSLSTSGASISLNNNMVSANTNITGINNLGCSTLNNRTPYTGYLSKVATQTLTGILSNIDLIQSGTANLIGNYTIAFNEFVPGATWMLKMSGTVGRSANNPATIRFISNLSGFASVQLFDSTTLDITVATATGLRPWSFEALITCRTVGSLGTFFTSMNFINSITTASIVGEQATSTATIGTNEDRRFELLYTSTGAISTFTLDQLTLSRIY